ncbi:MAG TPA: PIG-L deacetylase family protein [Egibacteraceae bacterium]|jgi:LmbE family N-acetylglucosaminyl deacetylase|nr:PIG-L deacetylase family protein [Egibacteraceae bacterium]
MSPRPTLWTLPRPFRRALVVVAHPDDAEFGAAGTIARWVQDGTEVSYVVLTDGAAGSSDPAMTRERLAPLRMAEQRAACAELGVEDVTFLGHPDGYLQPTVELRREVAAQIRRHRPEAVVTINPEMRWTSRGTVNHPDHRVAGDLVLHAINPAASRRLWDPSLLEEGLAPWDVSELWMMSFGEGPHHVDVTATFGRKVAAIRRHASQLGERDPGARMRERAAERGREVGVELSEAFTVLRFRDLEG